jgi:hypothetical protein
MDNTMKIIIFIMCCLICTTAFADDDEVDINMALEATHPEVLDVRVQKYEDGDWVCFDEPTSEALYLQKSRKWYKSPVLWSIVSVILTASACGTIAYLARK